MPLGAHLRLHDVGDQRPASAATRSGAASFADGVRILRPSSDLFSDDAVADAVAVADNHGVSGRGRTSADDFNNLKMTFNIDFRGLLGLNGLCGPP